MPSTTESINDSVSTSTTNTVPNLDNLINTATTTSSINQSITNLNLTNLENGLLTNNLSEESLSYLNDKLNNNQNNTLINSNNLSNNLLATPTEQPTHYQYLKEFRVDQCPLFVQHKCTQHKPFTCFHWHFQNQRRRRPIRKKDGTFNYSPDNYCTKYDETTGICPDGDDCTLLHRTAGDTERRYHLRYYKTGICVYDTDNRGFCAKNGAHCAFAHGATDLRNPLYDIHEMTLHNNSLDEDNNGTLNGYSTSFDKDRNALIEDIRWQESAFVLANYKTELCKKPPRLCRQGYACPQYHNSKDKRRTPKKFKYRSTPCPSVKNGDEWGDPQLCESGDQCNYCHTRTEQQFHPEIYKSTKCNDVAQTGGFCPRGPFCAFAHNDQEMNAERELSMDSAELQNILNMTSAFGNQTNSVLDKSTLNASTNSNNSTNGLSSIIRNQFNSNQQLNQQFQSSNSISIAGQQSNNGSNFMPSSVPTHFGFPDLNSLSGLRSQQTSGLAAFGRRENSPPMLSSNSNNLGPIARPRSYSSSHTSNLHHNLNSINRENFLNSFFKNQSIEEKTTSALNGLVQQQQQNILPLRKVSTPSTLFAGTNNNTQTSKTDSPTSIFSSQQFTNALQSNLVNSSNQNLSTSMQNSSANQYFQNLDSTSTTVESVVHSLALDDLTIDDLEESIEKDLLLQEKNRNLQQLSNNSNNQMQSTSNLVRSSSNLINNNSGTAPVNIPGANQRADIANINSPLVGFGQSPLAASLNQNISSSVGSSLYDFASHSGMSPTNQQQLNLIQQQQQQQQQSSQQYLMNEINRLRDELAVSKSKGIQYEEELQMTKKACEFWKQKAEKAEIEKDMDNRRNN